MAPVCKGAKMGITQMAQRIKQIHPDYVVIFKVGAFCNTFGKDSYIIASTFNYIIKTINNIPTCGFSKKALRKGCINFGGKKD